MSSHEDNQKRSTTQQQRRPPLTRNAYGYLVFFFGGAFWFAGAFTVARRFVDPAVLTRIVWVWAIGSLVVFVAATSAIMSMVRSAVAARRRREFAMQTERGGPNGPVH